MIPIREFAPAKINLTLEVAGRRGDGLHEIASLVAFADAGDVVVLDAGGTPGVTSGGPFAGALAGPNILDRALALLQELAPHLKLGAVHLEKYLPVAAGIGGGSADAGALLRAVRALNGADPGAADWHEIARALGADVPVCLAARACWMTGAGAVLREAGGGLAPLDAVLVNPMAAVPSDKTAQVFRALGAAELAPDYTAPNVPALSDRDALLAFMRGRGNDLADAAQAVVPEVADVLNALLTLPDAEHAALSGAGPTCFAILPNRARAEAAAHAIAAAHPGWWVVVARLG